MPHNRCDANRVKPLKFRALSEEQQTKFQAEEDEEEEEEDGKQAPRAPNFSLQYSFPAVVFENICFSVDRSQQQSGRLFGAPLASLQSCVSATLGLGRRARAGPSNQVAILKSVNLSVPHGSIFGLLGPSSCGKTTLLRCLVGLLEPSSGSIHLFGHRAHAKEGASGWLAASRSARASRCQVPGANVGYMPQELGLYEDFSIRQLLTMFGRYMNMSSALIKTRIKFMADFLELPNVGRQIASLSGGQKRRVSFAIACLHMPPLIILDEPTVGVDPLLRQSIWKYLRRLASEERKTIIITTHYIEEAAQADQVAFMRAGEILVQDSPGKIVESNGAKSLEEAFLKICANLAARAEGGKAAGGGGKPNGGRLELHPQQKFVWRDDELGDEDAAERQTGQAAHANLPADELLLRKLRLQAEKKLELFDELESSSRNNLNVSGRRVFLEQPNRLTGFRRADNLAPRFNSAHVLDGPLGSVPKANFEAKNKSFKLLKRSKWTVNESAKQTTSYSDDLNKLQQIEKLEALHKRTFAAKLSRLISIFWALLYKNYRRNANSLPLLAFQFMLPVVQMVSFSLCVGGRPVEIGLGLVNNDILPPVSLDSFNSSALPNTNSSLDFEAPEAGGESLSLKYLSFLDKSMLSIKQYDKLEDAIEDVRQAKLWAALEIGANFTQSILERFDLDNFYQLDVDTIRKSVIKIYPDRSNKILDMICQRSLIDSYRKFLQAQFEHFKQLPLELKEPIYDIKPNLISNSIDGYTESIAPGLLASLTYIMAAGLTTFIMVVERSAGLLERTYTSGVSPVAYLLAHALFRSLVMALQIAVVLVLTFYILKQPLVGSIWLAYLMLITINLTGIAYGLLISSLVGDQNGAALTIVSSLVVKITLSGILWPFEAIPEWLRVVCYAQPLTMPVQALKWITLKGGKLGDRPVNLGFLVALCWLVVFLVVAAKRFKFYQH